MIKKINLILLAALFAASSSSTAQCNNVPTNVQLRLIDVQQGVAAVQVKYEPLHANGIVAKDHFNKYSLFGAIFALTWDASGAVEIKSVRSLVAPFDFVLEKPAYAHKVANNIATFYHGNDMPQLMDLTLFNNEWVSVALIEYTAYTPTVNLSLLDCSYGKQHPNSPIGNSSTDPWFAIYDMATSDYIEYTPTVVTPASMPVTEVFLQSSLYPNPAKSSTSLSVVASQGAEVTVELVNAAGQVMRQTKHLLNQGENLIPIEVAQLASGVYALKLSCTSYRYQHKLTVQ